MTQIIIRKEQKLRCTAPLQLSESLDAFEILSNMKIKCSLLLKIFIWIDEDSIRNKNLQQQIFNSEKKKKLRSFEKEIIIIIINNNIERSLRLSKKNKKKNKNKIK